MNKYDDIQIVGKNSIFKIGDTKQRIKVFYHGGVKPNFDISKIDIYRKSEKQQNDNKSYVGFYMYGEDDLLKAQEYAIQENKLTKSSDRGVAKIEMKDDLRIYTLPPFTITRLTKEQLQDLKQQGYDLVCGKMLGKYEYVLLNKSKIINLEFKSLEDIETLSKEELEELKYELTKDESKVI